MTNRSVKRNEYVVADLVQALGKVVQPQNIATQAEILDEYSHDAWPVSALEKKLDIHQFRPDIVVTPRSKKEILGVLKVAKDNQVPIMARGLGSSVTGQSLATQGGIVIDLSKIVSGPVLSISDMTVSASAGMRGSDLEEWLNKKSLTMNFFPQLKDLQNI